MRCEFHQEALEDYSAATRWYAEQDLKLAFRFIDAVEESVARVVATPLRWRVFEQDVRRGLTRVFPYAVLYTIEVDFILIVAVMHCSREPGYWKSRVTAKPEQ